MKPKTKWNNFPCRHILGGSVDIGYRPYTAVATQAYQTPPTHRTFRANQTHSSSPLIPSQPHPYCLLSIAPLKPHRSPYSFIVPTSPTPPTLQVRKIRTDIRIHPRVRRDDTLIRRIHVRVRLVRVTRSVVPVFPRRHCAHHSASANADDRAPTDRIVRTDRRVVATLGVRGLRGCGGGGAGTV